MYATPPGYSNYTGADQGESIYNIIPQKAQEVAKPPMYRSKHDPNTAPSASTFHQKGTTHPASSNLSGEAPDKVVQDKGARTMGKAPGSLQPDTQNHLKKGGKQVPTLADVKKDQPHLLQPGTLKPKCKPGVFTTKDEAPVHNLVTSKNFVVANAVETILAAPKKSAQAGKDYLHKEDYGKVPKYLENIKSDINAEYEYIRQLQEQDAQMQAPQSNMLTDQDKFGLIMGLKAKWEAVNTDYQATTHLTKLDTIGKVKRKEKYEAELNQIEKDIEKLNRKHIYVDGMA